MEQKEPEKKMPSMHANAIRRSAKDLELSIGAGDGRERMRQSVSRRGGQHSNLAFETTSSFGAGTGGGAHLSIHLMAQSAFLVTQGMFCIAWKR